MVIVLSLSSFFSFLIIQFLQLTTKVGGGVEEEVWIQSLVLLMKETKLCHCARQKLKYNSLMLQCTSVPADE